MCTAEKPQKKKKKKKNDVAKRDQEPLLCSIHVFCFFEGPDFRNRSAFNFHYYCDTFLSDYEDKSVQWHWILGML